MAAIGNKDNISSGKQGRLVCREGGSASMLGSDSLIQCNVWDLLG